MTQSEYINPVDKTFRVSDEKHHFDDDEIQADIGREWRRNLLYYWDHKRNESSFWGLLLSKSNYAVILFLGPLIMKNLLYFSQSCGLILQDSTQNTFGKSLSSLLNVEPPPTNSGGYCFAKSLTVYQSLWVCLNQNFFCELVQKQSFETVRYPWHFQQYYG